MVGIFRLWATSKKLCVEFLPFCSDRIPAYYNNHRPCYQLRSESIYIEDGYNMTLTDAPNDFGGRLRLNCARTTPELPVSIVSPLFSLVQLPRNIPCGRVILPQITLIFDPLTSR
jgi:hypothetical protein